MDIFEAVLACARPTLSQAALHAARQLGLPGPVSPRALPHKLRALERVLEVEGLDPSSSSPAPPPGDWSHLAQVICGGEPVDTSAFVRGYAQHLDGLARVHAPGLATLAGPAAHVLDLGGGLGAYGLAAVGRSPGAVLTLVEAPEVAALARESLGARGDVEVVVADLLDGALPSADVILLVNVLHLLGPEDCRELVSRAAQALEPGGRLVIKELRGDSGALAAWFSLNMALYTRSGRVYTALELRQWCVRAGLEVAEHTLSSSPNSAVVVGTHRR